MQNGIEIKIDPESNYTDSWNEYKQLRRKFFLVWLGYTPACAIFASITNFLFHTFTVAFVFALAWMVWFLMAGMEIAQFSCPRCGEFYFRKNSRWSRTANMLRRRCGYCGLKKFAKNDLESDEN
jgi:predicted RNA-binding Zn-ribbon protein involved in translation (DUF1610 family)